VLGALVALVATAGVPALPAAAGGCGPTVKETLSGPAFNGMVPQGEARADESRFLCGGDTILTVQVKNVNLPDGAVLPVSVSFTPVGAITLSRHEGTMIVDVGHTAFSHDNVRVNYAGTTILIGGFFQ
jgi:hypothetical protein